MGAEVISEKHHTRRSLAQKAIINLPRPTCLGKRAISSSYIKEEMKNQRGADWRVATNHGGPEKRVRIRNLLEDGSTVCVDWNAELQKRSNELGDNIAALVEASVEKLDVNLFGLLKAGTPIEKKGEI